MWIGLILFTAVETNTTEPTMIALQVLLAKSEITLDSIEARVNCLRIMSKGFGPLNLLWGLTKQSLKIVTT